MKSKKQSKKGSFCRAFKTTLGKIVTGVAVISVVHSLSLKDAQAQLPTTDNWWDPFYNPESYGIADFGWEYYDVFDAADIDLLLSDAGFAAILAAYPTLPLPQVGETLSDWAIRLESWADSFGGTPVASGTMGTGSPTPQNPTYRSVIGMTSRMVSRQNAAVSAGSGWGPSKAPIGKSSYAPAIVHTPYVEYGYISMDSQLAGVSGGHIHAYTLGYDLAWDSGLILGINYEYADVTNYGFGDGDSHTIAAYGSLPVHQWNALLVGGYSEGATNFGPIQINSEAWFINPGVSRSWVLGDLVLSTTLSYLYIDSNVQDWGTLIPELGARYFLSDSLYIGSSIQYNSVVSHNFAPGVIDPDWWRVSAEVGVRVTPSALVTLGYDHDFSHRIQELHTARIGLSIEY